MSDKIICKNYKYFIGRLLQCVQHLENFTAARMRYVIPGEVPHKAYQGGNKTTLENRSRNKFGKNGSTKQKTRRNAYVFRQEC